MPMLTFTRDAASDLFPLYASQIFNPPFEIETDIALLYFRLYWKFLSENVMTGADTYLTHGLFRATYIFYLSIALHYSRLY